MEKGKTAPDKEWMFLPIKAIEHQEAGMAIKGQELFAH